MKEYFKGLKIKWIDSLFVVGLVPSIIFIIFGQRFMRNVNPVDVDFTLTSMIVCFVVCLLSWLIYIFLNRKLFNIFMKIVFISFVSIAVINIITILLQPSSSIIDIISDKNNNNDALRNIISVNVDISPIHKTMFCMEIIVIIFLLFIGLFLFPKRFNSILHIKTYIWVFLAVIFAIQIHSYITEYKNYYEFIIHLFAGAKQDELNRYTVKSLINNQNGFGMILLVGIILSLINHSLTKKIYNIFFVLFFSLNLFFTLSRGSLILAILAISLYIYFTLFYKIKTKKIRSIIFIIVYTIILGGIISMIPIAYKTEGKIFAFLYTKSEFTGTLKSRFRIWQNTINTLSNGNWIFGRGFGIINLFLHQISVADKTYIFETHNAVISVFAEGGILFILGYLLLIALYIFIIIKTWKSNPKVVFALSLGVFIFLIYGLIETNQYLMYLLLNPLLIFYEKKLNFAN